MSTINLNAVELELLKDHKKKARNNLIRDRAHAILLIHKNYSIEQVADILDRGVTTVEEWINKWSAGNISSIFTNYENNSLNNSPFTKEQLAEIKLTLSKSPDGDTKKFWSVKKLKEYLKITYNVVYESERSYHHLLQIHNFSFKLPEGFDKRRNEELVSKRMLEIKEIIEKHKSTHEIFFADECSLYFTTEYRRMWLPKGEKTILKVNKSKDRQNYFGAWNTGTGKEHLIPLTWQNTETIIYALDELIKLYPNKKLLIIWDNAGWHKSKELKKHLGPGNKFENIIFAWLPAYAPDNNPQEHIWKFAKDVVKNDVSETFTEIKSIFEKSIQDKIFAYKVLREKVGI